jgi:hypothetical protein
MRDNNVTPGGMVSVLGNLMMGARYTTRGGRAEPGTGLDRGGEPEMAAALKNVVSARRRSRELRRVDPASVGHQTPQAPQIGTGRGLWPRTSRKLHQFGTGMSWGRCRGRRHLPSVAFGSDLPLRPSALVRAAFFGQRYDRYIASIEPHDQVLKGNAAEPICAGSSPPISLVRYKSRSISQTMALQPDCPARKRANFCRAAAFLPPCSSHMGMACLHRVSPAGRGCR